MPVAPLYVLAPVRVNVPEPAFPSPNSPPVFSMTPLKVELTLSVDDKPGVGGSGVVDGPRAGKRADDDAESIEVERRAAFDSDRAIGAERFACDPAFSAPECTSVAPV